MKLKLYELSTDKDLQYVLSTINEIDKIRSYVDNWDHGGIDDDIFYNTFQNGKCREIKSSKDLDEVRKHPCLVDSSYPEGDLENWIPYYTGEVLYDVEDNEPLYLDMITIGEYLEFLFNKELVGE